MDIQLAASPFHVFAAGALMFLLAAGLTFIGHHDRRPKRFDVWEFAVVPLIVLATLLLGYWAIDIDRDHAIGYALLGLVFLIVPMAALGPFGILAWLLMMIYTLRYGGAALDLIGAACTGILAGSLAGYLSAVLWRRMAPRKK
jgi:hypothetical protein